MKKLILPLITAAILIFAGISAFWYIQSNEARKIIVAGIKQINGENDFIRYDAVQLAGFPLKAGVKLVNPHIKLPMGLIYHKIEAALPSQTRLAMQADPQRAKNLEMLQGFIIESQQQGGIILSVNIISDRYDIRSEGDTLTTYTLNGQSQQYATSMQGSGTCSLKLERPAQPLSTLWDFQRFQRSPQDLMRDFRALECDAPAYASVSMADNNAFMSSGPSHFAFTYAPRDTAFPPQAAVAGLVIRVKDFKVSEAYDKLSDQLYPLLMPANMRGSATRLSLYGNQNFDIEGTVNWQLDADKKLSSLQVQFKPLNIETALWSTATYFAFSFSGNAAQKLSYMLQLASENRVTPEYIKLILSQASEIPEQAALDNPQVKALLDQIGKQKLIDATQQMMPRLDEWGAFGINADLQGEENSAANQRSVDIRTLEFFTKDYRIGVNGSAKAPQNPGPNASPMSGGFTLTCTSCGLIVKESIDYYARMRLAMLSLHPLFAGVTLPEIPPGLPEGIRQFMAALAKPPEANAQPDRYVYEITTQGTVNGKSILEMAQLFGTYIAPHLPKPQPAQAAPSASPGPAPRKKAAH